MLISAIGYATTSLHDLNLRSVHHNHSMLYYFLNVMFVRFGYQNESIYPHFINLNTISKMNETKADGASFIPENRMNNENLLQYFYSFCTKRVKIKN